MSEIDKMEVVEDQTKQTKPVLECLINSCADWEKSYELNNNTGNYYEIETGKYILRHIKNILGIYNYTQNDNIGGTSDLGILYQDGRLLQFSVTKYIGSLSKCIRNPSGHLYSLQKTPELFLKNEESYQMAINYRIQNKGSLPNKKWKRCSNCPGSKNMCEYIAELGSRNWNLTSPETKLKNLKYLLDLDSKCKTNSYGIIYWDEKNKNIKPLRWNLKIRLEDYLETFHRGIYIYHGKPDDYILRTQTKYNNGIIEGMSSRLDSSQWKPRKSKNYLSSWNCVAPNLDKIFNIEELVL